MNKRSKRFLTILLCVAIIGNFGCTTTTHRVGPAQAAMDNYGIGKGDFVLVRYANKDDPRSSCSSEIVQITNISRTDISGVGENGKAVHAAYDEIFQIEHKKLRRKNLDEMPRLKSALGAASAVLFALGQYPGG